MTSCKYIPTIINKEGKEVDSILFQDILAVAKDRDVAKYMYAIATTKEFKLKNLRNLTYDENGEPAIGSIESIINFEEIASNSVITERLEYKNGFNELFSSSDEAVDSAIKFNSSNNDYSATILPVGDKYKVNIISKDFSKDKELSNNKKIYDALVLLMNKHGFSIKRTNGLSKFNPINPEKTADGLIALIELSNGEITGESLAEEFSHMAIDGLQHIPLVRRILDNISMDDVQSILKENFDEYARLYDNDSDMLIKEAAGKLLSEALKGNIIEGQSNKKSLLERLINYIKQLFSNVNKNDIRAIKQSVKEDVTVLAENIINDNLMELSNLEKILSDSNIMYNLSSPEGIPIEERIIQISDKLVKARIITEYNEKRDARAIKLAEKDATGKTSFAGLLDTQNDAATHEEKLQFSKENIELFLNDVDLWINNIGSYIHSIVKSGNQELSQSEEHKRYLTTAQNLVNLDNFLRDYSAIINEISSIIISSDAYFKPDADNASMFDLIFQTSPVIEQYGQYTAKIDNIRNQIYTIQGTTSKLKNDIVYKFLGSFFTETTVAIGKDKGKTITLKNILERGNSDLNFFDTFLNSASGTSDILLSVIDNVIQEYKYHAHLETEKFNVDNKILINNYIKATGSGNTEFMFEKDEDGIPTGYYVSDIDYGLYESNLTEMMSEAIKIEDKKKQRRFIGAWHKANSTKTIDKNENMSYTPNKIKYASKNLKNLNAAQREYYDGFITLKRKLDSMLGTNVTNSLVAIQKRDNIEERVSLGKKTSFDTATTFITEKFMVNVDDTDIGGKSTEEVENYWMTQGLDINGIKRKTVPVFYTTKLKNLERLSLDASATLEEYAGMTFNYTTMSEITDMIDLVKDKFAARKVVKTKNGKKMVQVLNYLDKTITIDNVEHGRDTALYKRLEQLIDNRMYGEERVEGGSYTLFGKEYSTEKTLDTIRGASSWVLLGYNMMSTINNVIVGKYQVSMEAMSKKHFSYKNLANADANYFKLSPARAAELTSNQENDKLSLLITKYIKPFTSAEKKFSQGYHQNAALRFFGNFGAYVGQQVGEDYLSTRTLLALMDKEYLINTETGERVKLIDALDVGEYKLTLNSKYKKEDGSDWTSEDDLRIAKLTQKINQDLHGIYNQSDINAIQRYALGRMIFQNRRWILPFYNRRFNGVRFNARTGEWNEGFYRTGLRVLNDSLFKSKMNFAKEWEKLSDEEKQNVTMAATEISFFLLLSLAVAALGGFDDKDKWYEKMLKLHARRLQMEVGIGFNPVAWYQDGSKILQSPAASLTLVQRLYEFVNFTTLNDEIKSGDYKGKSVWRRDLEQNLPIYGNFIKFVEPTQQKFRYLFDAVKDEDKKKNK